MVVCCGSLSKLIHILTIFLISSDYSCIFNLVIKNDTKFPERKMPYSLFLNVYLSSPCFHKAFSTCVLSEYLKKKCFHGEKAQYQRCPSQRTGMGIGQKRARVSDVGCELTAGFGEVMLYLLW